MKLKYNIILISIALLLATLLFAEKTKYVGHARTELGDNYLILEFDSTHSYLTYPHGGYVNFKTTEWALTKSDAYFYYYNEEEDSDVEILLESHDNILLGGGSIDGVQHKIKLYKVNKTAEGDYAKYPSKYINIRDKSDTLHISILDTNLLKIKYKEIDQHLFILDRRKILTEDCTILRVDFKKNRPYIIQMNYKKDKLTFYRATK